MVATGAVVLGTMVVDGVVEDAAAMEVVIAAVVVTEELVAKELTAAVAVVDRPGWGLLHAERMRVSPTSRVRFHRRRVIGHSVADGPGGPILLPCWSAFLDQLLGDVGAGGIEPV
jgi:hypothetical protein